MPRYVTTFFVIALVISTASAITQAAPKVIKTVPPTDARDVHPKLDEIRLTFDVPIKRNSHSLVLLADFEFPDLAGEEPITFPDHRTCVIKVKLSPNKAYGVGINSKTRKGFKSADDGTSAEPFELKFRTGDGTPKPDSALTEAPHVVKTEPPNRASGLEPGTLDVKIVFDQPMAAEDAYSPSMSVGEKLRTIGTPSWENSRTFVIPVMLAAGKVYRLRINAEEVKKFKSAGNQPAAPFELVFSTVGAKTPDAGPSSDRSDTQDRTGLTSEESKSPKKGPIRLKYDYRKGDVARFQGQTVAEMKIDLSNGQKAPPMNRKVSIDYVEEVIASDKGQPAEVGKIIGVFTMQQTAPDSGQMKSSPKLEGPVRVKVDLRSDPPKVETLKGEVSKELMEFLVSDTFVEVIPTQSIQAGKTYQLPPKAIEELKQAIDPQGAGKIDVKLTAKPPRSIEIEDGLNEATRAMQGDRPPITYVFDVVEFGVDWKQDGAMEGGLPFELEGTGEIVFAIDAGVLLAFSVDARIRLKPAQIHDENGQSITVTGSGAFTSKNTYQPINWTRGARRKGSTADSETAVSGRSERSEKPKKAGSAEIAFKGGDGSSIEKAIIVTGAPNAAECADAMETWMERKHPGFKPLPDEMKFPQRGARNYIQARITTRDGRPLTIFFDVTECDRNDEAKADPAPQGIVYEGGDGSSIEKAVIIKGASSDQEGIRAESDWIRKNHPGWELQEQTEISAEGGMYDQMEYLTPQFQRRTIYFRISHSASAK